MVVGPDDVPRLLSLSAFVEAAAHHERRDHNGKEQHTVEREPGAKSLEHEIDHRSCKQLQQLSPGQVPIRLVRGHSFSSPAVPISVLSQAHTTTETDAAPVVSLAASRQDLRPRAASRGRYGAVEPEERS